MMINARWFRFRHAGNVIGKGLSALLMATGMVTGGAGTEPACARPSAQPAIPGAGWVKVHFMYTNRPPPTEAWLVPLLARYGPRHADNGLPGSPVIYAVWAGAAPGSRIVLAIGPGDVGCTSAPQGRGATLAPDNCPTHILAVDRNGTVRARQSATGCYIWAEPDDASIDSTANAVYVRLIGHPHRLETRTLIGGRALPSCALSVPLD